MTMHGKKIRAEVNCIVAVVLYILFTFIYYYLLFVVTLFVKDLHSGRRLFLEHLKIARVRKGSAKIGGAKSPGYFPFSRQRETFLLALHETFTKLLSPRLFLFLCQCNCVCTLRSVQFISRNGQM